MTDLHLQHNTESVTCFSRLVDQITNTQKVPHFSLFEILVSIHQLYVLMQITLESRVLER